MKTKVRVQNKRGAACTVRLSLDVARMKYFPAMLSAWLTYNRTRTSTAILKNK